MKKIILRKIFEQTRENPSHNETRKRKHSEDSEARKRRRSLDIEIKEDQIPWIYIIISLHGIKMSTLPLIENDIFYFVRGCADNVDNLTNNISEQFKKDITNRDTFESIMRKTYHPLIKKKAWVEQDFERKAISDNIRALVSQGEVIQSLANENIGTRQRFKPRKPDFIRNKNLGLQDRSETFEKGFGLRFETNVEEIRKDLDIEFFNMNKHVFTTGPILLSTVLDMTNRHFKPYCDYFKKKGVIFVADLSCNGGLSKEEYLDDYSKGALGTKRKHRQRR